MIAQIKFGRRLISLRIGLKWSEMWWEWRGETRLKNVNSKNKTETFYRHQIRVLSFYDKTKCTLSQGTQEWMVTSQLLQSKNATPLQIFKY